ncbi:MAG: NIPSNAP family protein [Planctomycetaceae bacterium]|nr:NIPSNAP family protein [Planctomycetaceae bacterium]
MKRRDFLATGIGATVLSTASQIDAADPFANREFIEFRTYSVKDETKKALLVETLDKALIPALNTQGIKSVGVFVPIGTETKFEKNVFVVIPHKTVDSYLNLTAKLLADTVYRKNAVAFFTTTSKDPVYEGCESSFLKCFENCPKLETPELGADRIFQARIYRSFNIERNAAKIHMFDHGGEMALFRELGIHPIFFGEALSGKMLPNLTYMVASENAEKHEKAWKDFVAHPKWQEIKNNPAYTDTATEISRVLLKPSPGSQI